MNTPQSPADLVRQLVEALETAHNGLEWYRERHPDHVNGSDDEADEEINAALTAARAWLQEGQAQPLSDEDAALDLLVTFYDAYEEGPDCYEDPEDHAGHLGKAIKLDDYTDAATISLLNRRRPRNTGIPAAPQQENAAGVKDMNGASTIHHGAADASGLATGVLASGLTEQLVTAVEANEQGHDPLCMSVLRGKACTCGVLVSGPNCDPRKPATPEETAAILAGVPGCPESGKHCNMVEGECQTCGASGAKGTEGGKR